MVAATSASSEIRFLNGSEHREQEQAHCRWKVQAGREDREWKLWSHIQGSQPEQWKGERERER